MLMMLKRYWKSFIKIAKIILSTLTKVIVSTFRYLVKHLHKWYNLYIIMIKTYDYHSSHDQEKEVRALR